VIRDELFVFGVRQLVGLNGADSALEVVGDVKQRLGASYSSYATLVCG